MWVLITHHKIGQNTYKSGPGCSNAIHRINLYPVDSVIDFRKTYSLDSDLSGGQRYPMFEQPGPAMGTLKVRYSFKMLLNGLFQKKSTPP